MMVWTDEAVEELKKMWARGMTTGQIAKALNVTKNSIIGKVHRLALEARPSPIKRNKDSSSDNNKKPISVEKAEKSKSPVKEKATKAKTESTTAKTVVKRTPELEKTAPVEPVKPEERNIPLVKLDNHTCRWPLGDPKDEDFCFCGKRVKSGQTYCDEHAAIAYVKVANKKI